MSDRFARVQLLFQHQRFADAEKELRGILASEPDDPTAHSLLALCLIQRDAWQEATDAARAAILAAPDLAFSHYVMATVMYHRDRYAEARTAIEQAIQIDPYDESQFGLLSRLEFAERNWQAALDAAERGLEIDPDDTACNNLRTLSLEKLGRISFAQSSAVETLQRSPDDPTAHAVQGWTLLSKGDHQQAKEHFREALRLDPNNEFARQGMIDALNAQNPIFRLVFRFYVWMGRLSGSAQWAVMLGGLFGQRMLRALAKQYPKLEPFIWPILIAYITFAMLTWIANPLFNTFLRFNRFGRYLLTRDQVWASNFLAGIIGLGVLWVTTFSAIGSTGSGIAGGLFCLLLLIPVASVFNCDRGWPRVVMTIIASTLAVVGGTGVLTLIANLEISSALLGLFVIGAFLSQFAASYLMNVTPRK